MERYLYSCALVCFLGLYVPIAWAQSPSSNACVRSMDLHVVVLGSSTAAGAGPSTPDSAWVNRYRVHLQALNPANQVTNLARGGASTYNIMPDTFTPPPGRPMMDMTRNITQALSLQPDAIIINFPSNDASAGYDAAEQMRNFRLLAQIAADAQVALWICTTQPRYFSDPNRISIQVNTRDSIQQVFGAQSVDFWSGFADTNQFIRPIYDSGDGVHLNDAAHRVLEARIRQLDIPVLLADTSVTPDLQVLNIWTSPSAVCGDSNVTIYMEVGLDGIAPLGTPLLAPVNVEVTTPTPQILSASTILNTCSIDTLPFVINTIQAGTYLFRGYLDSSDTILQNDSSAILSTTSIGRPQLIPVADTNCIGSTWVLQALGGTAADTVLWYDQPVGGQLVGSGPSLVLNGLTQSQTVYPTQVRGPLYHVQHLDAATTTNINWNGVTFDLLATGSDTLIVDSLSAILATTGQQTVVAYYRQGSQMGYANQPSAWTRWDAVTVNVTTAGGLYGLDFQDLPLAPGDTVGIYLHLQNSNANLSYLRSSAPLVYTDGTLRLIGGSGVTHTFGTLYALRNWGGKVHYHYGFNEGGFCQTPRQAVSAVVDQPTVNLGADTTLLSGQSLTLTPGGAWASYAWSGGSATATLTVDSATFGLGTHTIVLDATTANGCTATDTIVITISPAVGARLLAQANALNIYPNPSAGQVWVQSGATLVHPLMLYNAQGQCVYVGTHHQQQTIDLGHLPSGVYWFFVAQAGQTVQKSLVLKP